MGWDRQQTLVEDVEVSARPETRTQQKDEVRWFEAKSLQAYAIFFAVACVFVTMTVLSFTRISPFDESTHADLAWRISEGQIPRAGDPLSQEVLEEWSCRGLYNGGPGLPPCDTELHPHSAYPNAGTQYNFFHPPVYYFFTGLFARAAAAVFDVSFITAARSFGAVWLALGLALTYQLARRMRLPHGYALVSALFLASIPMVIEFSSIVSNDAAALACGAGAGVLGLDVLRGRAGWKAIVCLALLVTMTKAIFAIALVAISLAWLIESWTRGGSSRLCALRSSGLLLGVSASAYLLWARFQESRMPIDYVSPVAGQNTDLGIGFPVGATINNLFSVWPPTYGYLATAMGTPHIKMWVDLSSLLVGAGVIVVLFANRDRVSSAIGFGVAAALVLVPVVVQTVAYRGGGWYFPIVSPRYGMVLLPMMTVLLAYGLRWRHRTVATASLALLGTVCFSTSLLALS